MNKQIKTVTMCIIGVFISAIGVSLFKVSALGVDPFIAFITGINQLISINFGTLYTCINLILLSFSLIFNKKLIGLATFINLFLFGYVVDFSYNYIVNIYPNLTILSQFSYLIFGVLLLAFGSSLYFTSNLGVSTYDTVGLIISDTWKLAEFKYARMCSDLCFVVIGGLLYILSGNTFSSLYHVINIGTIITIFCMGPLIDFFIKNVARKI